MAKKKIYQDRELALALEIVNSSRGSMAKAAHYLDCSASTAKMKLLEYQNKQLQARENSGGKIIPLPKQA
ncbi:MAG TPA: hypothetical protein H9844_02405 [Candidatus Evtepia faecigallinarum]|nr:hypothetical protein [Candidatus Evtepia faecigallinarum]